MSDSEEDNRANDRYELFSPLVLSTISVNGTIEGINPNAKEDINKFNYNGNIVEIGNNFICKTSPEYAEYKKQHEKKKRTQKKSSKKSKSRRIIGNNTHLYSQITFILRSRVLKKNGHPRFYKIKVFQKGSIQIPGIVDATYADIGDSLNDLVNYLRFIYDNPSIRVVKLYSSMQNYLCKVSYSYFRIKLDKLRSELTNYKMDNIFKTHVSNTLLLMEFPQVTSDDDDDGTDNAVLAPRILAVTGARNEDTVTIMVENIGRDGEDSDFFSSSDDENECIIPGLPRKPYLKSTKGIKRYTNEGIRDIIRIMCGHTQEQIAEIVKDSDKSASVVSVKLYRSTISVFNVSRDKDPKRTTIKVMQGGKINFEGGNSRTEAIGLRQWFMKFVSDRKDIVIGNVREPYSQNPNSSDSGESIYADFEPVVKKKR